MAKSIGDWWLLVFSGLRVGSIRLGVDSTEATVTEKAKDVITWLVAPLGAVAVSVSVFAETLGLGSGNGVSGRWRAIGVVGGFCVIAVGLVVWKRHAEADQRLGRGAGVSVAPWHAAFIVVPVVTLVVVGGIVVARPSVLPVSDEPLIIECDSPAEVQNIRDVSAGKLDEALFADRSSVIRMSAVVDHVPELHITGPDAGTDTDAVAVLDKVATNKRYGGDTDQEFIVASKTDARMMLVGARSGLLVIAERAKKKWVPRYREFGYPCHVRTGLGDETTGWSLLRRVEPDDSRISIGVTDYCQPHRRRLFSAVTLGTQSVIVTVFANPLARPPGTEIWDPGFCTEKREVVVDLGEPIGDRELVNGSTFPPRPPYSAQVAR